MTRVYAIENNNARSGRFLPLMEGALMGAAAGYVLKGTYPVTEQEKSTPAYKRVMSEINEKRNVFGPENEAWLNEIKSKNKLTLAQDTFVKSYDGLKHGDKLGFGFDKKMRENYLALQKQDVPAAQEFRRLMHEARYELEKTVQRSIDGYNSATKEIRPLSFFLIGGAVVGAIISLVHDVLKTDVKH